VTSIHLTPDTRDAMRAWAARTGRPQVTLLRDALTQIVSDPTAALVAAQHAMTRASSATPWPLLSDRQRWADAQAALLRVGSHASVGSVVRGLVLARLDRELP